MISTQITRLVFFMVVRAGTEQDEIEGSDKKKKQYRGFCDLGLSLNLVTISCFRTFLIFI